ncbi:hypothetical protein BE04_06300 [Sorangium cellulosum]|uniref:Secreted protein n=1 Tax=Sorangium cellulosum TaxID=56 RepID=A0A150PU75_SORCE|nr:hypothetical protein BE04_06300 [Sorangium cellulosum]
MTLRGFRSRWMTPRSCAAASAAAICRASSAARAAGTGPFLMMRSSVVPRTCSSTRNREPSGSVPKSVADAMFGCWMCAPAIASRSKRAVSSGEPCAAGRRIFTASHLRRSRCSAL